MDLFPFFYSIYVLIISYAYLKSFYHILFQNRIIIESVSVSFSNYQNLFSFPYFIISKKPKPFDKCKLCSFTPNNGSYPPNSSPKDAIFVLGLNKLTNLLPIVKTLRTAGSRCRFFLFTDNSTLTNYKLSIKFFQMLEECGTEFVNLGHINSQNFYFICYLRYFIYKLFLIRYKKYFDRVIFMDLYDSIIQHDPFTTEFKNTLYLSDEGYILKNDEFNRDNLDYGFRNIMQSGDPELFFSIEQRNIIYNGNILNGGLQEGGTESLIKFCEIMEKSGDVKSHRTYLLDQSFLNMIAYSGYLSKRMNFTIIPKGSDLSSTIGIYVGEMNKNNVKIVFGNISIDDKFPAILHQFDRSSNIKDELRKVCPNDENFTDYLR